MNDKARCNLTAEEAAELRKTGSVETWTEIDPQPDTIAMSGKPVIGVNIRLFATCLLLEALDFPVIIDLPHGPNGRVWIAEPWRLKSKGFVYLADLPEDSPLRQSSRWHPSKTMPREASRFNAMQTTKAERVNGVWGFTTKWERIEK